MKGKCNARIVELCSYVAYRGRVVRPVHEASVPFVVTIDTCEDVMWKELGCVRVVDELDVRVVLAE